MKPKTSSKAKFNGREVEVKDSKVVLGGSTTLAGSCSTQLFMFQTLITKFGGNFFLKDNEQVSIGKASKMLSENPARIAKIDKIAKIEKGYRGDLLLFTKDLHLTHTFIAGRTVFDHQNAPVFHEDFESQSHNTLEHSKHCCDEI